MKELTRTQLAVVKRTAQNVKGLRTKLAKIKEKVEALTAEAISIDNTIEQFEAPIRTMTGGFSSEEVLNGTMDAITEQIEEMSKESQCCGCPNEENVKNEVENTQENVNSEFISDMKDIEECLEAQDNAAPAASNEIPYI